VKLLLNEKTTQIYIKKKNVDNRKRALLILMLGKYENSSHNVNHQDISTFMEFIILHTFKADQKKNE